MIKFIVFSCGVILMSLEMAGSRLLAPYYGNTIFVWASLISVLLVALACGYYFGGRLADRWPSFFLWAVLLMAASLLTLGIPFVSSVVNKVLFRAGVSDRWGSLVASFVIFFCPGALLGTMTPFAVKFSVRNLGFVAHVTGSLYAWSTLGNVFGTLFTAFYLVGRVGVFHIFVILGTALLGFSAVIFFMAGDIRGRVGSVAAFLLAVLSFFLPSARMVNLCEAETVIFQKDSFYNHILVTDNYATGIRTLRFDRHVGQTSIAIPGDTRRPSYDLQALMHLPVAFCPQFKRVLFVGGGGCLLPRDYKADYPDIDVDVVEIDPWVVKVSREYFLFSDHPGFHTYVDDGRLFVRRASGIYDIIILDVFASSGHIPFHMLTREFFVELRRVLSSQGVVCLNLISPLEGPGAELFRCVYKTLVSVFPQVYVVPNILANLDADRTLPKNIVLMATQEPQRITADSLAVRIQGLVDSGFVKIANLAAVVSIFYDVKTEEVSHSCVLTDDFAPVDLLYGRLRFP